MQWRDRAVPGWLGVQTTGEIWSPAYEGSHPDAMLEGSCFACMQHHATCIPVVPNANDAYCASSGRAKVGVSPPRCHGAACRRALHCNDMGPHMFCEA